MPTQSTKINPPFDPGNFVQGVNNPYMTLRPGTTYVYNNKGTGELTQTETTHQTKLIDDVVCTVVHDTTKVAGQLTENTFDYFAQDKAGNVWYFGEDTQTLVNGKVVSTEGTWRAGVNGASPGIVMEGHPHPGDQYSQEHAAGVAEDKARVVTLDAVIDAPYGSFHDALKTAEFTPLEPGALEHKFYIAGLGLVSTTNAQDPTDIEQLTKIIFDGTSKDDVITGKVGPDEVNGLGGNDHLNGAGGRDTVHGGAGNDVISGGIDTAPDLLFGDQGNDKIFLRANDKGSGGSGDDTLQLLDNEHFGLADGGTQNGSNIAETRGDILQFEGNLDLTKAGVSERITHIETLSMAGSGHNHLTLSVGDVLDIGDGELNPNVTGKGQLGTGNAVRVEGSNGDQLTLAGGNWHEVSNVQNVPHNFDVFAHQTTSGPAYVMVENDVHVHLT